MHNVFIAAGFSGHGYKFCSVIRTGHGRLSAWGRKGGGGLGGLGWGVWVGEGRFS